MLTIPEALQSQAAASVQRVEALRKPGAFFVSAMLAGAYIGVGVVLMIMAAGPMIAAGEGLAKLVAGIVFGVALTLVVFAGSELATSAMMVLPIGTFMRSISPGPAAFTLLATFMFNILGSFAFAIVVVSAGVLRANPAAGEMLTGMLEYRADASPLELFARGVLCNALVCLAVWMGARVRSEGARIALIFIAITAFVTSGFEHVVANMTIYSLGILLGDPNATLGLYAGNLLWVGLGNLAGGALVVGLSYWIIGGRPRYAPVAEAKAIHTA